MLESIYAVRHADHIFLDGTEVEGRASKLSRAGRVQAYLLAFRLRLLNIDALYSSSYTRTQETAAIISRRTGLPVITDDRFAEFCPSESLRSVAFKEAKAHARRERTWHAPDGESFDASVQRFSEGLRDAVGRGHTRPCIVTHALVLQNMLMHISGGEMPPDIETASMTAFKANDHGFGTVFQNKSPLFGERILRRILRRLIG